MVGIGHLDDHRIDHWQVQARRQPVIQKTGIHHVALIVVVILFVERPANALHRPALQLAFHITGMDRLASILDGRIAQDSDFPCLRVHLNVDDMGADRRTGPARIDPGAAGDWTTGGILTRRDLPEGEPFIGVLRMAADAVPIFDLLDGTLPGTGGPFAHLPLDVLRRLIRRPTGLKCHAAAAGVGGKADRISVSNRRIDVLDRDPQYFGQLLGHRGTGAADIRRAFDELDPTIRVDNRNGAGGTSAIAPEPTGHTTAAVWASEWGSVMRVILGRLQRLDKADTLEDRTSRSPCAFFGAVEQAELERVHTQLFA